MALEVLGQLSGASLAKLASVAFWAALYINATTTWPGKIPEWHSRVITLLHGSVATVVGLFQCGLTTLRPCSFTRRITIFHYALMMWSWGYFVFDLLWCLLYMSDGVVILCHHASAIVAILIYMWKDHTGCTFPCMLAMMEITNPLLQTRWFLKYEGYDQTSVYLVVEWTYLILFLIVRGVLGSYVLLKILGSPLFDIEEKIITVVFYIVSLALLNEVLGYVLHRYKDKIMTHLDRWGIILND